jgi:hypothetical protein
MDEVSAKSPHAKFSCTHCDYNTSRQSKFNEHLLTAKHKRMNKFDQISAKNLSCASCNYTTSRQSKFDEHLLTAKHQRMTNPPSVRPNPPAHICSCGKSYKFKQGLSKHKAGCNAVVQEPFSNTIVLELLQQNREFKELLIEQNNKLIELSKEQNKNMMELAKEKSVTMTNSNNNNNTHFNLQFFLNNTCKDAITADDFVDNIKITFDDLENVGNQGYVKGITDIIMKQLKTLDVTKRPFHCTDTKRETMYIKDEKEWNKDDQEKTKLKKVIAKVADKNYRKIPEWREENPECKEVASEKYEFCIDMMRNSLGGLEDDQIKLDNKIIKAVAKEVYVDTKN